MSTKRTYEKVAASRAGLRRSRRDDALSGSPWTRTSADCPRVILSRSFRTTTRSATGLSATGDGFRAARQSRNSGVYLLLRRSRCVHGSNGPQRRLFPFSRFRDRELAIAVRKGRARSLRVSRNVRIRPCAGIPDPWPRKPSHRLFLKLDGRASPAPHSSGWDGIAGCWQYGGGDRAALAAIQPAGRYEVLGEVLLVRWPPAQGTRSCCMQPCQPSPAGVFRLKPAAALAGEASREGGHFGP